jgi:hypothetical protein
MRAASSLAGYLLSQGKATEECTGSVSQVLLQLQGRNTLSYRIQAIDSSVMFHKFLSPDRFIQNLFTLENLESA